MRGTLVTAACSACAWLCIALPARASAQVIGGQAVEERDGRPLVGLWVRLLRHDTADPKPPIVDSARTDAQGLFQVATPGPGIYQLDFGPSHGSIAAGPLDTVSADTVIQHRYRVPVVGRSVERPYFEFQVEQPVVPLPGNRGPRYPLEMKQANVEGVVLADFVVDTAGRVEPRSFHALRSTAPAFTAAVQDALVQMRFRPARIAGVAVRQRVQQPFQFQLTF